MGSFAAVAPAKKLSPKAKARISAQLRKQVKKNPRVVQRKSFLKKASLVNFRLPITVRLRGSSAASNPNIASIDLGASLGQRRIGLGGKLAGEIRFADSFDGGALGNVELSLNPGPKSLTSTSIPLLWNSNVRVGNWDFPYTGTGATGCGDFISAPFAAPYFANAADAANGSPVMGTVGTVPGIDNINLLTASPVPGNFNNLGPDTNPFPYTAQSTPYGFTQPPDVRDTIFRTTPLDLQIAQQGTQVNQSSASNNGPGSTNGPEGSQNLVIGQSGGQANLFGNIPGKNYGIDVTVNLATKINSIFRIVDQDSFGSPLLTGARYPAGIFGCRQIYSGFVQNYIPAVHLTGSLKISPGITSAGVLRIAKATIASPANDKARFAVAACLSPYAGFASPINSSDTNPVTIPPAGSGVPPYSLVPDNNVNLPADPATSRATPDTVACDAPPTRAIAD